MFTGKSKDEIRKHVSESIKQIKNKETTDNQLTLNLNTFYNVNLLEANKILSFKPYKDEPNISDFSKELIKKKLNIYFPHNADLKIKKFGEDNWEKNFDSIDLVFVPGRAFNPEGHRLGRGYGWYDRVIKMLNPKCTKVGICYEFQVIENIPVEEHDERVDYIITEKRIIKTQ